MDHSEYKDKYFHVFVSYSKSTGEILTVTYADSSKLTWAKALKMVERLNEQDDDVLRKVFRLSPDVSQLIYYLITNKAESDHVRRKLTEDVRLNVGKINRLSSKILKLLERQSEQQKNPKK